MRKHTFVNGVLLLLSVLLLTGIGGCTESPPVSSEKKPEVPDRISVPDELLGKWRGTTKDENGSVVGVELTVDNDRAKVYYSRRECGVPLKYIPTDGAEHFFDVTEAKHGWCRRLLQGQVILELQNAGSLRMTAKNKDNDVIEELKLKKIGGT